MTALRLDRRPRYSDHHTLEAVTGADGLVSLSGALPAPSLAIVLTAPGRLASPPVLLLDGAPAEATYLELPQDWLALCPVPAGGKWWIGLAATLATSAPEGAPCRVSVRLLHDEPRKSCTEQGLMPAASADDLSPTLTEELSLAEFQRQIEDLLDDGEIAEAVSQCLRGRLNGFGQDLAEVSHRALAAAADDASLFVSEDALKLLISLST